MIRFLTNKVEEEGTGPGMAITHAILRKHKAETTFVSSAGYGTQFTLTFPIV